MCGSSNPVLTLNLLQPIVAGMYGNAGGDEQAPFGSHDEL